MVARIQSEASGSNKRFYARLSVENPSNGRKEVWRVPLKAVSTVAEARKELNRLLARREDNDLPALKPLSTKPIVIHFLNKIEHIEIGPGILKPTRKSGRKCTGLTRNLFCHFRPIFPRLSLSFTTAHCARKILFVKELRKTEQRKERLKNPTLSPVRYRMSSANY
jgi:hypothetical protein